jgi:hypothetical protein
MQWRSCGRQKPAENAEVLGMQQIFRVPQIYVRSSVIAEGTTTNAEVLSMQQIFRVPQIYLRSSVIAEGTTTNAEVLGM